MHDVIFYIICRAWSCDTGYIIIIIIIAIQKKIKHRDKRNVDMNFYLKDGLAVNFVAW